MGVIAIFTAYIIGAVKLKYPWISHYHEAVGLLGGKFGQELSGTMLVGLLLMLAYACGLSCSYWNHRLR